MVSWLALLSEALPICMLPIARLLAIFSGSRGGATRPATACMPTSPPFTTAAAMAGMEMTSMPAMAWSLTIAVFRKLICSIDRPLDALPLMYWLLEYMVMMKFITAYSGAQSCIQKRLAA